MSQIQQYLNNISAPIRTNYDGIHSLRLLQNSGGKHVRTPHVEEGFSRYETAQPKAQPLESILYAQTKTRPPRVQEGVQGMLWWAKKTFEITDSGRSTLLAYEREARYAKPSITELVTDQDVAKAADSLVKRMMFVYGAFDRVGAGYFTSTTKLGDVVQEYVQKDMKRTNVGRVGLSQYQKTSSESASASSAPAGYSDSSNDFMLYYLLFMNNDSGIHSRSHDVGSSPGMSGSSETTKVESDGGSSFSPHSSGHSSSHDGGSHSSHSHGGGSYDSGHSHSSHDSGSSHSSYDSGSSSFDSGSSFGGDCGGSFGGDCGGGSW